MYASLYDQMRYHPPFADFRVICATVPLAFLAVNGSGITTNRHTWRVALSSRSFAWHAEAREGGCPLVVR